MSYPSISAVIATYHNPPKYSDREFAKDAVASVRMQTHQPADIEVVMVDGGSPGQVFEFHGADRLIGKQVDEGVCAAIKVGMENARGSWLIPMNADDQLAPHFVKAALEAAYGGPTGPIPGVVVVSQQPLTAAIEHDNYIPYLAMFARWFWDEMGGFQDVLGEGGACRLADWDLWIRVWQRYGDRAPVAYVTDPSVIKIRNRPDSASKWTSGEFLELRSRLWKARGIEP